MKHLLILNDPPYGTERSFNGLRMAHALAKHDPEGEVTVFLMADAVLCAKAGQKTPEGYYVRRRMIWNSRADFVADGLGSSGSGYAA
jgi:uncharacterized protein involved in oxidation of intracellular sulfur